MPRLLLAAALLLSTAAMAASGFVGTWHGRWDDPAFHQHGAVTVRVDGAGRFSGPIGNDTLGLEGVVSGTITPDGAITMEYSYDGGLNVQTGRGRLLRSGDHLHGTVAFAAADGQSLGNGIFDLDLAGSIDL